MFNENPILNEDYIVNGITNNNGLCIKKSTCHKIIIDEIKKHFTFQPYIKMPQEGVDYSINVWHESKNYLFLPKFTNNYVVSNLNIHYKNKPIENNLLYKPTTLLDLIEQTVPKNSNEVTIKTITFKSTNQSYKPPIKINITFNGSLRDYQHPIIETTLNALNNNDDKGGLLVLSCGSGKTALTIYLACLLRVKTLVVTYQCFLIDQWKDEINLFTNAKVGVIKGNICDVDGYDIVIASLKSLSMREYDIDFTQFGLSVYDECHHSGSKIYSLSHLKTRSIYTLGLSATPFRQDLMHSLIELNLGPILCRYNRKVNYKIMVKKVLFNSQSDKFIPLTTKIKGMPKKSPNHAKMVTNLTEIASRNKLIMDILIRLKTFGRKIFVFSSRTKHVEQLKRMFDAILQSQNEQDIFVTGIMHGKIDQTDRRVLLETCDIIFSTQHIAEEALNATRFNTILLALPYNNKQSTTIQTVGRILRNITLDSYLSIPLVIDMVDLLSIYSGWATNREKVYLRKKWHVQEYYWNDNTFMFNENNAQCDPIDIMLNDVLNEEFIENNLIFDGNEEDYELSDEEDDLVAKYDAIFDE